MQNTFLLRYLRRLSKNDWKELRLFVKSPWANQREEAARFFEYLDKAIHGKVSVKKEEVWKAVFPKEKYSDKKLHYTASFLLAVIKKYFVLAEMREDETQKQLYLCRALGKRGLHDDFLKEIKAAKKSQLKKAIRNPRHHFDNYLLEIEEAGITIRQRRSGEMNWQNIHDELTTFFMGETLRQSCNMLTHQTMTEQAYNLNLLDAVLGKINKGGYENVPAVSVYFHAYMALSENEKSEEKATHHFFKLKGILKNVNGEFPLEELGDIYLLAINFCIRKLNSGVGEYIREAFELYRSGLSSKALFKENILSAHTYKNASRLGMALGENKWVSDFLIHYKKYLAPRERENIWRYNYAHYHFRLGEYGAAMELLRHVEFNDTLNNLDARRMLLRSYFELNEFMALDSLLDTFRTYIRRQKNISYHRANYLNLIKFTRKLMEVENVGKANKEKLRNEIMKEKNVAEKEWLLSKLRMKDEG